MAKDLINTPIFKLFLSYFIPSFVSMFVLSTYVIVDGIFVGKGIGESGLGAIGIVTPIFSLFIGIELLFGIGGSALVSMSLGKNKAHKARIIFSSIIYCLTLLGIFTSIIMYIFKEKLAVMLGSNDELFSYVMPYLSIIIIGSTIILLQSTLCTFARNDKVLYEYIDEIHEEITHSLPKKYLTKHKKILKNEKCYVVATADKLYNDVKKVRNKNFVLSTNGVNLEDFVRNKNDEVPAEIKDIRSKYDKILCYYGSLAVWFDYDLIKKVARKFSKYAIVLIGLEYDDSYKKSGLDKLKNVFYLGKKDYYELHKYSENSDLLIIPFLINDITESTSPVKLFEYMATNVPILTTNIAECRKYKSVIVGKNHQDFINKVDSTMQLINDKKYLELEMKEAKENTWTQKADILIDLLNNKEENYEKND